MLALAESSLASNVGPNENRSLTLEPVRNGFGVETMQFGPGRHVVGSAPECSHVLLISGVKPRHCEIWIESGRVSLCAIDFRTWLNNGPVQQAELHDGDRVTIGPLEFRCILGSAVPASQSNPPIAASARAILPPTAADTSTAPTSSASEVPAPAVADHAELEAGLRELEAQLAQRETRLAEQSQEFEWRVAATVQREIVLDQQESAFGERDSALALRETDLQQGRMELDRQMATVDERQAEVNEQLSAIQGRERELLRRDQAVHASEQELAQRDAQLADRVQKHSARERALVDREKALAQREQAQADSSHDLSAREETLRIRSSTLDAREAATDGRERVLDDRDGILASREQSLKDRETRQTQREQSLTALERQLGTREREIEERLACVTEREKACAAPSEETAPSDPESPGRANEHSAELEQRSVEQEKKLAEMKTELQSLRRRLESEGDERAQEKRRSESVKAALDEALAQAKRKLQAAEAESRDAQGRCQSLEQECATLRLRAGELKEREATVKTAAPAPAQLEAVPPAIPAPSAPPVVTVNLLRRQPAPQAAPAVSSAPGRSTPAAAPRATAKADDKSMHLDDAENPASVAAYMEQLLARSRRPQTDGEVCWMPSPKPALQTAAPAPEVNRPAEPEAVLDAVVVTRPIPAEPMPMPEPSQRQDRAAARADLDSLRNVANSAARSAIAQYTSKATRDRMLFRGLLLAISLGVAAALLSSALWGPGKYVNLGLVAVAASVVLAVDLLIGSLMLRRRRSQVSAHLQRMIKADTAPPAARHDSSESSTVAEPVAVDSPNAGA